jgi:DNA-binding response OmpR family regulator
MISLHSVPSAVPSQAIAAGAFNPPDPSLPLVLVADDETGLTAEIASYIRRYGMRAVEAHTFEEAVQVLQQQPVQAVLLDQRFGSVDTLQLLPRLRSMTDVPILMHTGNEEEMDRVLGLELGADDFLLKPVSGRELVARLRAHLRRPGGRPAVPAPALAAPMPASAAAPAPRPSGWRIVKAERRVYRPDHTPVRLTTAEFDTLAALAETPGETRTRDELTRQVFRREWRPGDRAVDNAVLHLRQKLQDDLGEHCIVTVRQMGYVFAGFPAAA